MRLGLLLLVVLFFLNLAASKKMKLKAPKAKFSSDKIKKSAKKLKFKKNPTTEKDMVSNIQYFSKCYCKSSALYINPILVIFIRITLTQALDIYCWVWG